MSFLIRSLSPFGPLYHSLCASCATFLRITCFQTLLTQGTRVLWQTGEKREMLDTDRSAGIDGAKRRRGAAHISSLLSSALQTFN